MREKIRQLLDLPDQSIEGERDREFVTSLARGLEVLRVFQRGDGLLGNQEISERTGLPKPTISRLTSTLTKLGYLEYVSSLKKYRVGAPVLALGYGFLSNLNIRKVATPLMQELADYAKCTVALCFRDRLSMLYVDVCQGVESIKIRADVGSRIPMLRSAAGLAFLGGSNLETRNYYIEQLEKSFEAGWPANLRQINEGIREIEEHGFCTALGLNEPSVNAVAAPLVNQVGAQIFSISCFGPSFQLTEETLRNSIGPRLINMITTIESELTSHH